MTTRRGFVAGLAGMSGWAASRSGYAPKLMVQPYVWTQQFRAEKISLAEGLEKAFPACQRAGYRRMQLLDAFLAPDVRQKTFALIRQYNFDTPVVYQGGSFHESEAAERSIGQILETADAAKEIHCEWI